MVKGKPSGWWHINQGVRQGSVLSPLLFSIAINPLIKELRDKGVGVSIGGVRVPGLLFADDLAVICETEDELRQALMYLDQWAKKKRFIFNAKKCGVLVTRDRIDPAARTGGKWMLGKEEIPEVKSYKYLGVDKEKMKTWKKNVERMVAKGKNRLGMLKIIGAHQHGLRPSLGKRLAEALLRPILEYGYEVLQLNKTQIKQIERVMLMAGRLITGLPKYAMNDAVYGELGWRTMEERNEVAKLKYFHRLRTLPESRLVKKVFLHRMNDAVCRQGKGWCNEVRQIMQKYGIYTRHWTKEPMDDDNVSVAVWWKRIQNIVEEKQSQLWKERLRHKIKDDEVVEREKGKFYLKCKREWGEAEYMNENGSKEGRIWKTRMRACAVPLQAELKREHRAVNDTCYLCYAGALGAVENHQHMLLECEAYATERKMLWEELSKTLSEEKMTQQWNNTEDLVVFLLSDNECDSAVRTFLHDAFTRRSQLFRDKQ